LSGLVSSLGRRALFCLDPETAHGLALKTLDLGLVPPAPRRRDERLAVKIANLALPNPIGMAAGFDKNAEVANALLKLGFGFAEVGTLTPRPQAGNPRPRIFRLVDDEAVINRLGFNNDGHDAALERLRKRPRRAGIVGVNIGANKDSEDRIADYVAGIRGFASVADYFTVNVSSPNTPGLRDLQAKEALDELLKAVVTARDTAASITGKRIPVFLKIAPDLDEQAMDDIAQSVLDREVDGLIVSNTTLSRSGLRDQRTAAEAGGLSGRPLFDRSTIVLAKMRRRVGATLPIIGVGGIGSAEAALEKISAGADAVQVYTGFIYRGPTLPRDMTARLARMLDQDGATSIADYRDRTTESWAARSLNP
jgi:dihydroorotate dehydrogenase